VCWINNWPECPLEVIELKSVVERLVMGKTKTWTARIAKNE